MMMRIFHAVRNLVRRDRVERSARPALVCHCRSRIISRPWRGRAPPWVVPVDSAPQGLSAPSHWTQPSADGAAWPRAGETALRLAVEQ